MLNLRKGLLWRSKCRSGVHKSPAPNICRSSVGNLPESPFWHPELLLLLLLTYLLQLGFHPVAVVLHQYRQK
jgi:hypothetical protein